ncbi:MULTISPECIES: penicillin-binding protein 1A [unclassified Janthinobacterium]|uniref:penicillin-binding protein 1A n=1 Tax=unclassified Janthinobacterium TaxID=2610881 RepID=UPI00161B1E07|nr:MULTISPECIES: PBP1A family penicillin-binding protein [unclassified Janthinobacterium]MBB5609495.1 penicillin-binding protein 1A [Janthinobacterium sp. S3T4]MBB5614658.1 penicillin-binding protein 1A [Janthinobacterium sp. S3M3]
MTASRSGFPWPSRRALVRSAILAICAALAAGALLAGYLFLYVKPRLPALDVITDYQPKIPLRVYTADHVLIGEFGEEHRDFVPIAQVPEMMKKALLAIEDSRFYEHNGIDFVRAAGAVMSNLRHGFGHGGGSTITMQVARNFFLTRDKVASRKLNEIMLALKIEAALSKDQILELYMNQMYLGQRSFGFASAAQTYFGKPLGSLSIAEMAMLAGLPQNPARHNPISNPKKAHARQRLVLKRMRELDYITEGQYQQALAQPLRINSRGSQGFDTHAEYVAELARQAVYAKYKEDSYTKGISVYTTILKADQDAAYESTRRNVIAYDQRHGYRGPETFVDLPADQETRDDAIDAALQRRPDSDGLIAAVVTDVATGKVVADTGDGDPKTITGDGLRFAAAALSSKAGSGIKLRPGAVIRLSKDGKGNWSITQVPLVAAAFVSLDAETGAYHAMVGGFDYNLQKFNHVTQAWRQPGSAMKPFVYSAALEKGFSPATLINDVPLQMQAGGKVWAPQNDDFKFDGPITMRYALAQSKNVASVRILRALGVPYVHEFIEKFGFDPARQPNNLTMALGTGSVTPVQMAGAYALFANGGHQVEPYLIDRIVDAKGAILLQTKPPAPNDDKTLALDPRNAYVMDSMLREVTRTGTGSIVTKKLGRNDIAGKTGTTSDAVDGWFAGYSGGIVAVAWMGYDDPKSLGGREFGATLALPIWLDYMHTALATRPEQTRAVPAGLSLVDGEWLYDEFIDMGAVKTLDMDTETPTDPAAVPDTVPPAETPQTN